MAFVLLAVPACRAETSNTEQLSIIKADGTSHDFQVEVADAAETRAIGLMFRTAMPKDNGMLFVFNEQEERPHAFWMKNTLIPLDIIYVHKDGKINHIHENAIPKDETLLPSNGPVYSVLEINGGRAAELGIRPGDTVIHRNFSNTLAEKPPID
jgi:uncharacterized membrane protein (UPF0127 family)